MNDRRTEKVHWMLFKEGEFHTTSADFFHQQTILSSSLETHIIIKYGPIVLIFKNSWVKYLLKSNRMFVKNSKRKFLSIFGRLSKTSEKKYPLRKMIILKLKLLVEVRFPPQIFL